MVSVRSRCQIEPSGAMTVAAIMGPHRAPLTTGNSTMHRFAFITLLALASPALAEDVTMDTRLGTTMQEVQTSLTGMGYEVRKAEMEDGKIEVYFVRDGQMGEAYVSTQTGQITKLEIKK
jgi:hypothetical protein